MKKWFFLLFALSMPLGADSSSFDDLFHPIPTTSPTFLSFFQVDGRGDVIFKRKIKSEAKAENRLGFSEWETSLGFTFPVKTSLLSTGLNYQRSMISLESNPYFEREHFQNGSASLGGQLIEGPWTFKGEISLSGDIDLSFKKSLLYFYGGWGSYQYDPSFSGSLGFLARSGIHQDKVWPVVGFDWNLTDVLELHALYPLNIALLYRPTEEIAVSLKTRFINSRHRLSDKEALASGIVEYRNIGEEIGFTYALSPLFDFNLHGGWMFKGELRVNDSQGKSMTTLKSQSGAYAGGSLLMRF